jgi:hypothetical protein
MSELEKGILPIVIGGLGNQMFIVAAGYACHRYCGAPLYIVHNPLENNPHNLKKRKYSDSIFRYIGTHLSHDLKDPIFLNYHKYAPSGFFPWFPKAVKPGTRLESYFQFYPPLEPFENDLRHLFLKGLQDEYPAQTQYEDYAFLHIRRGDYLKMPEVHFIQPIEYYEKAVQGLHAKAPCKILVFSNDMEWVRTQEFFKQEFFELYDSDDELQTLALMASCKAGAICANSTFSWWGAFLGAHSLRNPVYVPEKWISDFVHSLFPEEWNVL